MGIEYTLTGYDDPMYLKEVAELVNDRMQQLLNVQSDMAPHKNAVLSALNLADELIRTKKELALLQEEATNINELIATRSRQLSELCSHE